MKFKHGGTALLAAMALNGCNGKSNDRESNTTPVSPNPIATIATTAAPSYDVSNKTFLASNVLLGLQSVALAQDAATTELDPNTKVLAEQIQLSDDSAATIGRLKSKNLKDALNDEISPILSEVLIGKWSAEFKLANLPGVRKPNSSFDGTKGIIEFTSTGDFNLTENCFSAVNRVMCYGNNDWISTLTTATAPREVWWNCFKNYYKYEVISNSAIIVKYKIGGPNQNSNGLFACDDSYESYEHAAVLSVLEFTKNKIVVTNPAVSEGSSNAQPEVGVLTKIQ